MPRNAKRIPMRPVLSCHRVIIDRGAYKPYPRRNSKIEHREEWSLAAFDEEPWTVANTRCSSNVRVVCTTFARKKGATKLMATPRIEEVLPFADRSDHARLDLRLTFPNFGREYLHIMAYWLLKGRKLRTYGGDYSAFKKSGKQVDHGLEGHPHVLDYRTLTIQPRSGRLSNAAQGARLRWKYQARGGLSKIIRSTIFKNAI